MAKGIIGRNEKPRVTALFDQGTAGAMGECIGVVSPLEAIRRTGLAGEVRRCRSGHQEKPLLLTRDLLDRQRYRGSRYVDDDVDMVGIDPLARDAGADIGFILMVAGDDLNRRAQNLTAKVLDRHLGGQNAAFAGGVRVELWTYH